MSPILSVSNSLSTVAKPISSGDAGPTATAGVIANVTAAAGTVNDNTIVVSFVVQPALSTGGKTLQTSLENGKTLTVGALMNGSGTITVTRAAQDGHASVTSTATFYNYFSSNPIGQTKVYKIAPTENSGGLAGAQFEFDLATGFAADVSAQAPFSFYTVSIQLATFAFNVTVDSVLRNCTTSNLISTSSPGTIVTPA